METAYKFVIFGVIVVILIILWIPFHYVMSETVDTLNPIFNASDPNQTEFRQRNDTVLSGFYYTLFFFIIVLGIYVIKPEQTEVPYG